MRHRIYISLRFSHPGSATTANFCIYIIQYVFVAYDLNLSQDFSPGLFVAEEVEAIEGTEAILGLPSLNSTAA